MFQQSDEVSPKKIPVTDSQMRATLLGMKLSELLKMAGEESPEQMMKQLLAERSILKLKVGTTQSLYHEAMTILDSCINDVTV